ncbi:MAG: hypothetical protein ACJ8LG_03100 [Massilia sp.]
MSSTKRLIESKITLALVGLAIGSGLYMHGALAGAPGGPAQALVRDGGAGQASRDEPFALVDGTANDTRISGDMRSRKDIAAARGSLAGAFLWFRNGGTAYVVQDRDVLAKARAAWEPVERLGQQMDSYGREMDRHGKAMDALGKDMDAVAARVRPDERKLRQLERNMDDLGRQMERLGDAMDGADGAELERLERRMERMAERMQSLGQRMKRQHEAAIGRGMDAEMEEIGQRMHEAGKPMEELGKQMGALGKQMERESAAAENTIRQLIRESLAKGLARPAPRA